MLTIEQIRAVVADYFRDKPVKKVWLFGSYARGEAQEESDVDLMFSLAAHTRISYFGLASYLVDLEERLSRKIDFVEEEVMYPRIKKEIDKDKMLLYAA